MKKKTTLEELHKIKEECKFIQARDKGYCKHCFFCGRNEDNSVYCLIIKDYGNGMPRDWVLPEISD